MMFWIDGEYAVLRERAQYHLMHSGRFVATYPSSVSARKAAEEHRQQAEAIREADDQRARIRAQAEWTMKRGTKEGNG